MNGSTVTISVKN